MSHQIVQRGNRRYAVPGTIVQTGNTAPRFRWPAAIRVLIHCIAHYLDKTDDGMMRLRDFPDSAKLYTVFTRTVPWFAAVYDEAQRTAALAKDYPLDKLEPFGPAKVYNRLLYLFTEPGNSKGKKRKYGVSVEHPDNPAGHRRQCFAECSILIHERLKLAQTISEAEIGEWS